MRIDAKDLITAFNAVQTFHKPEKAKMERKIKKEVTFKDYLEFHQQLEMMEKWKKDQEKLNKKEEKKEEKKGMSIMMKTTIFALAGPPIGILYVFGILGLARAIGSAAGVK